jgi:hypothetical protein
MTDENADEWPPPNKGLQPTAPAGALKSVGFLKTVFPTY